MGLDAHKGLFLVLGFGLAVAFAVGLFLMANSQGLFLTLALTAFVGLVVASLASSEVALYALVLVGTTEALYKGAAPSMFTMLAKDVLLWVLLLRLFWFSQREGNYSWLHQPLTTPAVCFTAYCVAMMFAPSTRSILLALAGLRVWTLWMPLYFPLYHMFRTRRSILNFAVALLCLQLPICLYGIVQGNIGYEHTRVIPGFYQLTRFYGVAPEPTAEGEVSGAEAENGPAEGEGFERGFRPIMSVRACAIYISPGFFGGMAVLTVFLSLGILGWSRSALLRALAVVTGLAGVGGLMASGSRAPMVGLAVGLAAMTLVTRRRGLVTVGIAILALGGLYVLRDITGAGARRIEQQLTVATAFERTLQPLANGAATAVGHPFGNGIATGVGAGRLVTSGALDLRRAQGSRFIENEFGRALAELGFAGTFLWLWMVCTPLVQTAKAVRQLGNQPAAVLTAGLFGLMVALFTQLGVGSALYGTAGMFYYIFAAMSRRLVELPPDEREAAAAALEREPPPRRYGFVRVRG
jgi:hypothetical protein